LLGFQEFGNPSEIFGSRYGAVNPGEEVLFLSISTARSESYPERSKGGVREFEKQGDWLSAVRKRIGTERKVQEGYR
jgi:hypothetical protein